MWFTKKKDSYIYKKMGYVYDQEGIMSRYLRETDSWQNHLINTKTFISDYYSDTNFNSVAVLGSGWLLDLPIDEMIQKFTHIYLIDICHPSQITYRFRKFTNVHFIELDITGGLIKYMYDILFVSKQYKRIDCNAIKEFTFSLPFPVDFVISLNILNQLDILLLEAISKKVVLHENEICNLKKVIQNSHISFLDTYNYCLISDWIKQSTHIVTQEKNSEKIVLVEPSTFTIFKEWEWDFDTSCLYEENTTTKFTVKAFGKKLIV